MICNIFYGDCQLISINFFSALFALPVSIDCAAITSPSLKSSANPPAMIAAAAFKSTTSLFGLRIPSSTSLIAVALSSGVFTVRSDSLDFFYAKVFRI